MLNLYIGLFPYFLFTTMSFLMIANITFFLLFISVFLSLSSLVDFLSFSILAF